jgi:hypothetical protein
MEREERESRKTELSRRKIDYEARVLFYLLRTQNNMLSQLDFPPLFQDQIHSSIFAGKTRGRG